MNNRSTFDCTGLRHRLGGDILKIRGFGHSEDDWWVIADVRYDDTGTIHKSREIHPRMVVWSEDVEGSKANCEAVDKGIMDHLLEHGDWDKRGRWTANAVA